MSLFLIYNTFMIVKTMTWNIGGGKLLEDGKDPGLMSSYNVDGVGLIAEQVNSHKPDIITIQEAHGNHAINQIKQIANELGYAYYFYDAISDSHIDTDFKLGNGLISKFPISNVQKGRFLNPEIYFELEGRKAYTHDKGYGSCDIVIYDKIIHAVSLHLIPFRSVGLDFESNLAQDILRSVGSELVDTHELQLIQGDFNIHSPTVREYIQSLFDDNGLSELILNEPTTPKGRMYDHVLYRGLKLDEVKVDSSVKTDHYPVICTFEL